MKESKLEWLEYLHQAQSIMQLRDFLQNQYPLINPHTLKKMAIIGAAEEGLRLVKLCKNLGIEVIAWCDDHPSKQGVFFEGIQVQPTETLNSIDKKIPVIIASHRILSPIAKLRANGHQAVAAAALLQVLAPTIFPPHIFYDQWLESIFNNRDKLHRLSAMLADEKSLLVLNAIVGFRLTLNPETLAAIIDWDLYGSEDILNLTDKEIYIDGGTFDGDTIKSFIKRVDNKYTKIIGFEPDTETYHKLQNNFSHESRVETINKGLFSHEDTLYFDNVGTRASTLTAESSDSTPVPVTSIDEVLQGDPATLIKMNIEGAEIPALKGASKTILNHKPKLGISIYHRTDDLWEIPFLAHELNKDYKFYLRQHDGGVIESVLYAV